MLRVTDYDQRGIDKITRIFKRNHLRAIRKSLYVNRYRLRFEATMDYVMARCLMTPNQYQVHNWHNLMWPHGAIWRHRFGSILGQVHLLSDVKKPVPEPVLTSLKKSCYSHPQKNRRKRTRYISLKWVHLRLQSHLPGISELMANDIIRNTCNLHW